MSILYDMLRPRMIQTLALLIAISYVGVASRRWRPAMLFDAAMLVLVFTRPYPALLAFAVWLIGVRWIRGWANWMAAALRLDTFGGHTLALARFLLPAWNAPQTGATRMLMSSSEDGKASISGILDPVIPYQHTGIYTGDDTDPQLPQLSRDIKREEEIVALAVIRNPDKSYRHSANKIAEFVGGDRNAVLAMVREIRSGPQKPVYPPLTPDRKPDFGLEK